MKINTLTLTNFQGIKELTLDLGGRNASIFGDNATGKTTVFNAVTWLLFDKPGNGAKNFTPKTVGPDGEVHNLDHSAEAVLSLDDGRIIALKKNYREVYKKKRGSASDEFTGHTVDYYIDGVPAKESEYINTVITVCGSGEQMKMLTIPHYFPAEMGWESRRKILLETCGSISDEAVIASSPDLADLLNILLMPGNNGRRYSVDEYRKIAAAKKTAMNKDLETIPSRIDEATRAIPNVDGLSVTMIDADIAEMQEKVEALREERQAAISGGNSSLQPRRAIAEMETKITEAKAVYTKAQNNAIDGDVVEVDRLRSQLNVTRFGGQDAVNKAAALAAKIERLRERRDALLKDYSAAEAEYAAKLAETWDAGQEICPTCQRDLPPDQVAAMREEFNRRKSDRLQAIESRKQAINERGKKECDKTTIIALERELEATNIEKVKHQETVAELAAMIAKLESEIVKPIPFEDTGTYIALNADLARLRTEAGDVEAAATRLAGDKLAEIDAQIQEISLTLESFRNVKAKIEMVQPLKKRVAELEKEEKRLGKEYETIERNIYLCEQFVRAKVGMITDAINGKFKSVQFRLFVEQINGGLKDDCEVMIPSDDGSMVPYSTANNAARVNAGLEIISVLSGHWGRSMPVVIDNAESVTRLVGMGDTQVIRLVVSEADKVLRVEVE